MVCAHFMQSCTLDRSAGAPGSPARETMRLHSSFRYPLRLLVGWSTWLPAALCVLLLWPGCAAPAQELWPPPPETSFRTIYVSLDAWHAMIAFPLSDQHSAFSAQRFEEWGYAERAWYLEGRQGPTGVLRALFWPTEGVVEVGLHDQVWAARSPQPPSDLFIFRVSEEGYHRLRSHLLSTIASPEPIVTAGETRFYPAKRSYHLFHQCHQYAARALQEAGLPISVFWVFNRTSLAMQLDRMVHEAADEEVAAHRLR